MKLIYSSFIIVFFITQVKAQSIELEIIDSLTQIPVENVYIYNDTNVFYAVSNNNGICNLNINDTSVLIKHNFIISHIGYTTKLINLKSVLKLKNKKIKILLVPKIFEIEEISISPPNAKSIISKAIEKINENYFSLINDTINLDVNFTFLDNPNKIADFNGKIAITKNDKEYFATKYCVKNNLINKSFFDYGTEISPSGFYSILFIKNHSVIRRYKKMKFYYDGQMKYQKEDVYKISFERKSKYAAQKGYLLINSDNYAITYITYTIGKCEKWIASTQKKKGLVFTNLEHYKVSASYLKNNDKYMFKNGSINMLFNKSKKKKILSRNTYNVTIKSTNKVEKLKEKKFIKIDELFTNKKTTQR